MSASLPLRGNEKNFESGVLRQRNKQTQLKNNISKFLLHSDEQRVQVQLRKSSETFQRRPFFTLEREDWVVVEEKQPTEEATGWKEEKKEAGGG